MLLLGFVGLHRVDEQLTTRMFTVLEFSLAVLMGSPSESVVMIVSSNDGSVDTLLRNSDALGQLIVDVISNL